LTREPCPQVKGNLGPGYSTVLPLSAPVFPVGPGRGTMAESVGDKALKPSTRWCTLARMTSRHVVIVVFPGVQSLDAVGPFEVFAGATRAAEALGRRGGYRVTLASTSGAPVAAESGLNLCTESLPERGERIDTLVVAGGEGAQRARGDAELLAWITAVAPRCRRVATVCTGAFIAAAAGLLDGRRVTTHWARAGQLGAEFPSIVVDPDPIYVRDGKVWTSAGVTAGIDLALALVQDDLGDDVAQMVARWLVMYLHRPGGQTQFASPVWVPRAERSAVRAVQTLVEVAPGGDHRLPSLAAAAAMSVRHFARVFTAEVGETPGRFVERVRLEAARRELETTRDTLAVIADRCGFGTAETLRRVFQRRLGVAPDSYRRRFGVVVDERTPA
jgi:transcriptional regulator GlxA family with amidase domain